MKGVEFIKEGGEVLLNAVEEFIAREDSDDDNLRVPPASPGPPASPDDEDVQEPPPEPSDADKEAATAQDRARQSLQAEAEHRATTVEEAVTEDVDADQPGSAADRPAKTDRKPRPKDRARAPGRRKGT